MTLKPAVTLPTATIIGAHHPPNNTTPKPLETFNRIPYAHAPRFQPPTPYPLKDTIDCSTPKSASCPNPMTYGKLEIPETTLTLNITRPAGLRRDANVPVVVYLHGGGFNFGSPADADAKTWVGRCGRDVVVVAVAYRLGALGFGPGEGNLGLRDQRVARRWVDQYIGCFGGDRGRVVWLGVSAGGHSVGHYILNPEADLLPTKVILESASPTSRSTLSPQHQRLRSQTDRFQAQLPSASGASLDKVLDASLDVWSDNMQNLTWPWQPVIAEPISDLPLNLWQKVSRVPDVLTGFCRTEGHSFIQGKQLPFTQFWKNLIPNLPHETLEEVYPADMFADPRERLYTAYGDYAYKCPVLHTAHMVSKKGGKAYVYEYAGQDGTKGTSGHCCHGGIVRGHPNKPGLKAISLEMQKRWESFITDDLDKEEWPAFETPFGGQGEGNVLVFGEGNDEAAGGGATGTAVRSRVLSGREREVCEFWWGVMELSEGMGERGVVGEPY